MGILAISFDSSIAPLANQLNSYALIEVLSQSLFGLESSLIAAVRRTNETFKVTDPVVV